MSEYLHIARGDDAKYTEYMKLINKTFSFHTKHDDFLNLLPKLYKTACKPVSNNVVLDVDGEMRAAIGLYYNTLNVCGEKLLTGGIGNVAVHPKYRGLGYMKFTMAYCLDEMKQRMCDISFLGGQRQRYEYFSYEPGGKVYTYRIGRNNLRHTYGADYKSPFTAKKITSNKDPLIDRIAELHSSSSCTVDREREKYLDILKSWRAVPYAILGKNGEFKGYFIISEDKEYISEFELCDITDIDNAVVLCVEKSRKKSLYFAFPEYASDYMNYFEKRCECFRVEHNELFSVLCYENVIKAYLKLKATYTKLPDGEFTAYIDGEKLPERIKISVKNNEVTVCETDEKEDISLGHKEAMKLFFGLYSERRAELDGACASWFPLPLFINGADTV